MYGQIPDPTQLAMQACAAMGGQWSNEALECTVGDQVYKLPDFKPGAMPPQQCPPDMVKTPTGCHPYPGGVVNGNGPPVVVNGNGPPPQPVKAETPEWVLPAVIGIGAIAFIALVAR